MAVTDGGRAARTRYRVSSASARTRYCEIELETGRTHQIRVHMAHIRAPLARRSRLRRPPEVAARRERRAARGAAGLPAAGAAREPARARASRHRRRARFESRARAGPRGAARRCCAPMPPASARDERRFRGSRRTGPRRRACGPGSRERRRSSPGLWHAESRDARRRRRRTPSPRTARRLRAALELPERAALARASARHSACSTSTRGRTGAADAAVTRRPACRLRRADGRLSARAVLRPRGGRVGVAHAGWRGLLDGVLPAAVAAFGVAARATSSPGSGPRSVASAYEVGADVRDAFVARDRRAAARFRARTRAAAGRPTSTASPATSWRRRGVEPSTAAGSARSPNRSASSRTAARPRAAAWPL